MLRQRTIGAKVSCRGVGLHCGRQIGLELLPAPEDNQITFVRTDLPAHPELRASVAHLASTRLATTLAVGGEGKQAAVGTVEHLLAALMGLGIDNVQVLVDGPEIPIMDGSAAAFVEMLLAAGVETQRKPRRYLVVKKEVRVAEGDKTARLAPGQGLQITCSVDFDHPLISPTPLRFTLSERGFQRDIARARTFGFYKDVQALRAAGLALGGSPENAIVIDEYRVLNPEGLRFPDEFVRHKILDALGDLALFGMPVLGRVALHRAGHGLHAKLVKAVLADRRAYDIVEPAEEDLLRASRGEAGVLGALEPVESVA